MTVESRAALDRLIAAFEAHHRVVASGRSEDDPAFATAYTTLVDAFETYDEALFEEYGIDTPFLVYEGEDDDDDEDDDDEFELEIEIDGDGEVLVVEDPDEGRQ